jgi:hypothetical protein
MTSGTRVFLAIISNAPTMILAFLYLYAIRLFSKLKSGEQSFSTSSSLFNALIWLLTVVGELLFELQYIKMGNTAFICCLSGIVLLLMGVAVLIERLYFIADLQLKYANRYNSVPVSTFTATITSAMSLTSESVTSRL